MAKAGKGEEDEGGKVKMETVKLRSSVIQKAKYICQKRSAREGRKVSLDEYLTPLFEVAVEAEYAAELAAEYELLKKPKKG